VYDHMLVYDMVNSDDHMLVYDTVKIAPCSRRVSL